MKIINLQMNKKSPNFGSHTTVLKSQSINNTNEHYKIHIHIKPNIQGETLTVEIYTITTTTTVNCIAIY